MYIFGSVSLLSYNQPNPLMSVLNCLMHLVDFKVELYSLRKEKRNSREPHISYIVSSFNPPRDLKRCGALYY